MSNPPVGWYPDPTGQPNTLRWWNGTQWTNKTEKEDATPDAAETPASEGVTTVSAQSAATGTGTTVSSAAVASASTAEAKTNAAAISAAEKAKSTWMEPAAIPTAANHWTQQPPPDEPDDAPEPIAEPVQNGWTLKLADAGAAGSNQPAGDEPTTQTDGAAGWEQRGNDEPTQVAGQTPANTWGLPEEQQAAAANTWGLPDEQTVPDQGDLQTPPAPWQPAPTQWEVAGDQQAAPNQWQASGEQQTVPNQWQASGDQQAAPNQWQTSGEQQTVPNQWDASAGQQAAPTQWDVAAAQQAGGNQWQGNQAAAGQWQTGGGSQTVTEPWQDGGQQGAGQWQSGGAGQWPVQQGGGPGRTTPDNGGQEGKGGGSKVPLIIAAALAFVLIVAAGVFFLSRRDGKTAGPDPTPPQPTNTSSVSPPTSAPTTPGNQTTSAPGQSKNPKLHEAPRVASEAISFTRQGQPWSERKRLIAQLVNSSGQYVRLQENFDGKNDWYADMFVGALGTATPFNGDPQATASDLMLQARTSMYGDIPVTFKPRANGPVKRSGKAGWFYQQSVTVNSTKVTSRVLTLTVAVFDLGDGTAVAYISDIPVNRPDLRTAESQVYKGINVG